MATAVASTTGNRQSGAASDFFEGACGKVVAYTMTSVTNGQKTNVGWGARWVAWENSGNASPHQVEAVLSGDQVTFNTDGTRSGVLWVFYKNGVADARAATSGQTHPPDGIDESARDAQRYRMMVFDMSAVGDTQFIQTKMTGIHRMLWRSTGASRIGARFAVVVSTNQGIGKITFRTGGDTAGQLILLVGSGKGLDPNEI